MTDTSVLFEGMGAPKKGIDMAPVSYHPRPLGEHDVEVAIEFCGVCHSDLHAVGGDWAPIPYPMIPGHEIVGSVRRVGGAVSKFKVGDKVGVGPQALSCRNCELCAAKQEQYCNDGLYLFGAKKYPDSDVVVHGGYCNGIRVHEHFAIPLPAGFDLERGAPLLCAGVTTFKPLKDYKVGPGSRVGVIGVGGLGHLAIQFAAAMGADVVAFSRTASKADEAAKLGASALWTEDDEVFKANDQTFDVMIMTAAAELPFAKYFNLLKKTGTFVFIGAMGELRIPGAYFLFRPVHVTGSLIGSPSEHEECLAFAAKHNIYPWSTTFPMSEADAVVKAVNDGKPRYRYVLKVEKPLE